MAMQSCLATCNTRMQANAEALGLNHSPRLAFANVGRAARQGYLDSTLVRVFRSKMAMIGL